MSVGDGSGTECCGCNDVIRKGEFESDVDCLLFSFFVTRNLAIAAVPMKESIAIGMVNSLSWEATMLNTVFSSYNNDEPDHSANKKKL